MIHLSYPIIIEFILGLFLWWVAIYLITQNPFSRMIQVVFGIFVAVSFYFTIDIFFHAAGLYTPGAIPQFHIVALLLKVGIWSIYLPMTLLYHASLLLIPIKQRRPWQKTLLYFAYLATFLVIYLEAGTNLTRNYSLMLSPNFSGNFLDATGKYMWIIAIFFVPVTIATAINFYLLLTKQSKFSRNWYKFLWPFLGMSLVVIFGPIVLLSYYKIIPHPIFLPALIFGLVSIPILYSIIKHDLFIEEAKIIFGKTFLYSTLGIFLVLTLFITLLGFSKIQFNTAGSLVFPYILIHLVIATHPTYNWLMTFIRDIVYNISSGLSVVNDEEVYQALKNYNLPAKLEDSPLLRLNLVSQKIKKGESDTAVDALRTVFKEIIEYFKPEEDIKRRTKQNLKYHLLKMIAFDQAEEGQILWELGFEDYPLRILSKESQGRSPLFKSSSPSDYNYISRNAFIALKKEAIHNITWRISYLEKVLKKHMT